MARQSFRALLDHPAPILGTWSQLASEEVMDIVGGAGFAFTIIDCEHGAISIETAERLVRAADANGIAPVVRLPTAEPFWVGKAFDIGASAVVAPQVSTAAEAAALVAAGRFAPEGTRGACPCVRAGGQFITDWQRYAADQRTETGVLALIETAEGLSNVEAIAATPGLLGLVLGPFDLAVSLGREGDYRHPDVEAGLLRILAAGQAAGLAVIAPVFDPDPVEARRQQQQWAARGISCFVVGTDKIVLASAMRRYRSELAEAFPPGSR